MIQPDEYWMNRALRLAEKGRPFTSPNPLVGACLVKHHQLIAEGYHTRFGCPHAEIEVLSRAGKKAAGATLYVTLEPCSTYGKTPPCTEAIKRAKIKKVVIGTIDPNPKHNGRSISFFKKNDIQVKTGILKGRVLEQNETFIKWIKSGLPFVVLKMAQSLDGKIASKTGSSRWISGEKARHWVHHLRARMDAVLIGKNTLFTDDPRLTARNGQISKLPWRIILDSNAESSVHSRIFKQKGPVVLVCLEQNAKKAVRKFDRLSVTVLPIQERKGKVDLHELMKHLGSVGISSLLVEGGGEVAWSFIEEKLVDKICWVIAPKIIGGRNAKTSVEGEGISLLDRAPKIRSLRSRFLGEDLLIEGYCN